jgi:predicted nucleic acid-binding protein
MIFVDTGAWFAGLVQSDANHAAAIRWMAANKQQLITTDFVVDETLTLLRARGYASLAERFGGRMFDGADANLVFLSEADVRKTWFVFKRYADKEWSFTDCSSKVIMERSGITRVFTFDHHFRQFGTVQVVP